MMAERSSPKNKARQDNEEKENKEVEDEALEIADGKSMCGLVEKIYLLISSGPDRQNRDGNDPGHPDQPFHQIPSGYPFVPCQKHRFLAAGGRTHPTAIRSAEKKSPNKQKEK